jgi:methyl-accepting chemotaxis protein
MINYVKIVKGYFMFPNVSIRQMLIRTGLAIVLLTFLNVAVSYNQLDSVRGIIYEKENEVLPHAINFLKLKNDVVQVQQWLTDISATKAEKGFDDGFSEAKKHFDNGNKILNHLIKEHEGYNETEMVKELRNFKSNFDSFYQVGVKMANTYIKKGTTAGNKMMLQLDPYAEKLTTHLEKWITEHLDENSNLSNVIETKISLVEFETIIFGLAMVLFIIFIFWLIATKIGNYIVHFQEGLLNFFEFLNKGTNTVPTLEERGKNEISKMAIVVNQNIKNTQKLINDDAKLMVEAKEVINRVKGGWYSQVIESKTSNIALEEFKNDVNEMIIATKEHFSNMNKVLEQYAKFDYTSRLTLNNIEKGGAFELLVKDINILRDAITEMLVENKTNGMTLQESSNILLSNVDLLNKSSSEAAASLEETAAALEEITSNVNSSSENIAKMSQLSTKVTNAASNGEKLATQTATSMEDIDEQVRAINDAIGVIDQIAFQTNILSLNAAVEAATAGEAGKGFAVVAQEVRNLAARSAEAANEIKELVEKATLKANDGKKIATNMIKGYTDLNDNITQTTHLINDVATASKEQQTGITQINDAVNSLDRQTQQNASVASQTNDIANQTSEISNMIVKTADEKEFEGKNSIKIAQSNTKLDSGSKSKQKPQSTISQKSDNESWESF